MEENIQMLKELNENMQKLRNIENEINMLELALYQKNIEEIKEKKITEITKFFERQSKFYNQKTEKYKKDIENNIEKYNMQIEKLILIYDKIYMYNINEQRDMQHACLFLLEKGRINYGMYTRNHHFRLESSSQ